MIQYSGSTYQNTTFTPATRLAWVQAVTAALSSAGWTTISGTPGTSADVTMETAAGNQGQKARFRFFDPAINNCAQVTLKNVAGTLTSAIVYCLPTAGSGQWRIVANKFSFYCFATGSANASTQRGSVFGGTIWVPTFLIISSGDTVGYLTGSGNTDADTTVRIGWRSRMRIHSSDTPNGVTSVIWLSTLIDIGGTASVGTLIAGHSPQVKIPDNSTDSGYRWEDGTLLAVEPLVSWATGSLATNEGRLKGQLYDAMQLSGFWAGEAVITYNSHNWLSITNGSGTGGSFNDFGSLFVAIS
jgi:hypothetical protein